MTAPIPPASDEEISSALAVLDSFQDGLLPRPIPTIDGFIVVESSTTPVPFHITSCGFDTVDMVQGHSMAVSAVKLACMAADIMRGRVYSRHLRRAMTTPCLRRLENMSVLMNNHSRISPELKAKLRYLPAIPHHVSGMFINPTTLETSSHLTIGPQHYWSNIVLRQRGCRWVCTFADIG